MYVCKINNVTEAKPFEGGLQSIIFNLNSIGNLPNISAMYFLFEYIRYRFPEEKSHLRTTYGICV